MLKFYTSYLTALDCVQDMTVVLCPLNNVLWHVELG